MNTPINEVESKRVWDEAVFPQTIAVVVDNNQPHWRCIVETAPNVTFPIGTKLFQSDYVYAYEGARTDLLVWKREAQRLQDCLRTLRDETVDECARRCVTVRDANFNFEQTAERHAANVCAVEIRQMGRSIKAPLDSTACSDDKLYDAALTAWVKVTDEPWSTDGLRAAISAAVAYHDKHATIKVDGMVSVPVDRISDEMIDDLDEVADWLFDQISGHTEYIGRDAGLGMRGRAVQLVVKRLRSMKDLALGNKAAGG